MDGNWEMRAVRRFKAVAVAAVEEEELNVFLVVMAERADGSGRRLEIQRALTFDKQARGLGMDTYCLVTESGATHYGGVVAVSLKDALLTVQLDEAAAEALDAKRFEIAITGDETTIEELRAGLARVLETALGAKN